MNWLLPALLYASFAIFAGGMLWRLFIWLRAPVPLKIVLTPGPVTSSGVARRLAGEVVLFRSLFGANRWLWGAAWLFHVCLLLLVVGHIGGLIVPGWAAHWLGLTEEQFHHLAQVAGGAMGILAAIPLLFLLSRRIVAERLRYLSTVADYMALCLLLLVIVTGNEMRFMEGFDLAQARHFVSGILSFQPVPPPANHAFIAHVLLVCVLLAYIPFSKLLHFGGLVFNPTLNQKNNPRAHRYACSP